MSNDDTAPDLTPRDWEDIYDVSDNPLDVDCMPEYVSLGEAARAYDGTLYVRFSDGWVAFDEVVAALETTLTDDQ